MADIHLTGASQEDVWPLVRDFHYSSRMPSNVQHIFVARKSGGLFGDMGEIIAASIWSIPPTRWNEPVLELSRLVKETNNSFPLTKLIAFSAKWLKRKEWDLLVSFADWTQQHHGGIYQAASWNFDGKRERRMDGILIDGEFIPGRSANSRFGTRSPIKLQNANIDAQPHYDEGKYLYWRALSKSGQRKAKLLNLRSMPYPKPNAGLEHARERI